MSDINALIALKDSDASALGQVLNQDIRTTARDVIMAVRNNESTSVDKLVPGVTSQLGKLLERSTKLFLAEQSRLESEAALRILATGCTKHPSYRGQRAATADCPECRRILEARLFLARTDDRQNA